MICRLAILVGLTLSASARADKVDWSQYTEPRGTKVAPPSHGELAQAKSAPAKAKPAAQPKQKAKAAARKRK
jgi:hypothetical protein